MCVEEHPSSDRTRRSALQEPYFQALALGLVGFVDSRSCSDVDEAFTRPISREALSKLDSASASLIPLSDRHTGRNPIHGDACAKAALYRNRFLLLFQRVSRDPNFSRPAFASEISEYGSCEISPIQSLVGRRGRRWIMGLISQLEDGHFYLEDLTAADEVDLSNAALDLIRGKNLLLLMDSSLEGQYADEDATALVELGSKCLQYEARDHPDVKFLLSLVVPLQKQTDVASHVLMGLLTKNPVVLPTLLSPLRKACARMDLTAVHDILLKTGYRDEEGAKNEVFTPLVENCKKYGRAMRIGTNHGSLPDRIMSYYGYSPRGMVESAFEFAGNWTSPTLCFR